MKNKFKKSKIIVPALALITATTAASVTGTVAWFTAARTATVTTDAFATTKTSSALAVEVTGDENSGTTTDTNKKIVKLSNASYKLTHGSYDAKADKTGHAYVADLGDDNEVTGFRDVGSYETAETASGGHVTKSGQTTTNKWKQSDNTWYAFAWTLSFKYTATSSNETNYLLFDVAGSEFKDVTKNGQTAPGFRIAFMNGSKFLVVGGDSVDTYVSSTTTPYSKVDKTKVTTPESGKTYYTKSNNTYTKVASTLTTWDSNTDYYTKTPSYSNFSNNYVSITDESEKLADDSTEISDSKFNLGQINGDGSTALTIQCVAWYEGSDPWIANSINTSGTSTVIETMSSITSSLSFYTRAIHA